MTRPPARRPARGLTLVEIVVVIGLIALLATMAAPSLAERLARQRLSSAAEALAMDMAEARAEAASAGQRLHIVFQRGESWCYAVARTADCDCTAAAACQLKVVRSRDLPGVRLASAEDAHFEPVGTAPGAAQVHLRGAGGSHELVVGLTPLGRPKVCSPTGLTGQPAC